MTLVTDCQNLIRCPGLILVPFFAKNFIGCFLSRIFGGVPQIVEV